MFPPETGVTIGPSGYKYFSLQIHCEYAATRITLHIFVLCLAIWQAGSVESR